MRTRLFGPTAALLVLTTSACGGGAGVTADIADDLVASSQGAISQDEAMCAAEAIVDALGDQAETYAAAMAGDVEAAMEAEPLTPEQQTAMTEGFEACDFDLLGDQ
jgi:hypothetical protein